MLHIPLLPDLALGPVLEMQPLGHLERQQDGVVVEPVVLEKRAEGFLRLADQGLVLDLEELRIAVVPVLDAADVAFVAAANLDREALVLGPGVRTGISLAIDNPRELGADRLANAVAAKARYDGPSIVVDFGTATTFDAVSGRGEYLGGAIAPGIETSLFALSQRAARLATVDLAKPERAIGKSTVESMRSVVVLPAPFSPRRP